MAPIKTKLEFLNKISNSNCEVIDKSRVDGNIFKNSAHGLGADFLKLFDYAERKYGSESEREGFNLDFMLLKLRNANI